MPPSDVLDGTYLPETEPSDEAKLEIIRAKNESSSKRQQLKSVNIVAISIFHLLTLYSIIYVPMHARMLKSYLFGLIYGIMGAFGVTAGAHRLWAHRAYKAKLPLRIILAGCYSIAGMNPLPEWVRDHRVHHRFSETDADPHNSNRGFFFSHVGWLMQKKHPDVLAKGKTVDMTDIHNDPVVIYHTKYFTELYIFLCFIVPMTIPWYFWDETIGVTFWGNILRYSVTLNATWSVNSAAHLFGNHPFSIRIRPAENSFVAFFTLGEGWHNYHHVFPWDYKAAEWGQHFNLTTHLLNMFAIIGWAYDMKSPPSDLVERVAKRFGDGSHRSMHQHLVEVDENGKEIMADDVEKDFLERKDA